MNFICDEVTISQFPGLHHINYLLFLIICQVCIEFKKYESMKIKVSILIGINIIILSMMIFLPTAEWMNYLMIVFIGIIGYLSYLTHLHYLPKKDGQKGMSTKSFLVKILFGISLSVLSMSLIVGTIGLLGGFSNGPSYSTFKQYNEIGAQNTSSTDSNIFEVIVLYSSSALAEEVTFRSLCIGLLMIPISMLFLYFLNKHKRQSPIKLKDSKITNKVGLVLNIFIALIFALVHKDSPGFGIIPFINISISGFIYGYLFLIQKDIISAWSMHLSWNLIQMFIGLPVSGKYIPSVNLTGNMIQGARDNIIAGGSYGPEGSIVAVVVQLVLLVILVLYLEKLSISKKF